MVYTIYNTAYDKITNRGSCYNGFGAAGVLTSHQVYETASSPANVAYNSYVTEPLGSTNITINLRVEVGGNNVRVYANGTLV